DSGVHAENFPCTFRSSAFFDAHQWLRGLDALLPPGIGVRAVERAADDFHAIKSATAKVYRYRFWRSHVRHPFIDPFVWRVPHQIDFSGMEQIAEALLGTHDFIAFCAADGSAKTSERTIYEIHVRECGGLTDLWICGDGFLKQMVRNIAGTLMASLQGKLSESIGSILAARDRQRAGPTAP